MRLEELEEIAEDALNEACSFMQQSVGVETGDLAAQFFGGIHGDTEWNVRISTKSGDWNFPYDCGLAHVTKSKYPKNHALHHYFVEKPIAPKEKAKVLGTCECGAPAQTAFLGQSKFICLDCDDKNDARRKIV